MKMICPYCSIETVKDKNNNDWCSNCGIIKFDEIVKENEKNNN